MNLKRKGPAAVLALLATLLGPGVSAPAIAQATALTTKAADYIVAIVNNELVTQSELDQRLARARIELQRNPGGAPAEAELRRQVLEALIDERVLITFARDAGGRIEDHELDRAIANIATVNQLTQDQLRERLRAEGTDFTRFRANIRDQMLAERAREREVGGRIRVTELEIEALLAEERAKRAGDVQLNLAQIMITVPEGASPAVLAERQALLRQAQQRLAAGEPFEAVARSVSEDPNRQRGGEIGLRPAARLPDLFTEAVKGLEVGGVTPEAVRSGAGFHLLKVVDRLGGEAGMVVQTRARHILLRPSARLTPEAASQRLSEMREQVLSGQRKFEDLARQYSEDGSAGAGGDLGWAGPGQFVPEFEQAMNGLAPLGISQPLVSRFGVHLIQVLERRQAKQDPRQAREQARNILRERKYEQAYTEWMEELRSRAYIEMREPPL
ncbi:peptidylprolyl isomerase [Ideonella livida]|nr:peptidylprolyl isomerase [Ideonella livida]